MKRFLKYIVAPFVIFLFLFVATVFVLPLLIDVRKYVPEIEEKMSEISGRPVSIGKDLSLSLFPWLCVSFSNMKVGNPQGFPRADLLKIGSFEARIQLLPLLKKELHVSRFVVGGLEINLETREDGRVNWDFSQNGDSGLPANPSAQPGEWYLPTGVSIALLAVTDGIVNWNDRRNQSLHKIDELMLLLSNVNTEGPTGVDFKASIDGKQLAVEGKIASIGNKLGLDPLAIDLGVDFIDTLNGHVKGQISNIQTNPGYDLVVHVDPFSPRELFRGLDSPFPFADSHTKVFNSFELDIPVKGIRKQLSIDKGKATLDETRLEFSSVLVDLSRKNMDFSLNIESLDFDRYLAPATEEKGGEQDKIVQGDKDSLDYSALRDMTLDGAIRVEELRIEGGVVNDLTTQVSFADGILMVDPMSFGLYQGNAQSTLKINFQGDVPGIQVNLHSKDVQAALLLDDFVGTDFLSGIMAVDVVLEFSGKSKTTMKKTLNGKGTLVFKDGGLTGVDLARTVGGLRNALSESDTHDQRARTEFSELVSEITIKDGLIESKETKLMSPFISLLVTGTADLVTEQLDLKFEPEAAENMKGQGEEKESPGGSMPLEISGSFDDLLMNIDAVKFPADETLQASSDVQSLVDKKLPSPVDEGAKNLVGKPLVNPDVIAQRFGNQQETINEIEIKKEYQAGSGKIRISPLQTETALY